MIPATRTRVERQTAAEHNLRIRRQTEQTVAKYFAKGPDEIGRRLSQVDISNAGRLMAAVGG